MGTVFNALTGRPSGYGIADWDVAYCGPSDLSMEREIAMGRRAEVLRGRRDCAGLSLKWATRGACTDGL